MLIPILILLGVAVFWDEAESRRASKNLASNPEWMERWNIGVTFPKKFNFPEDAWYDPSLPFWED